MYQFLIVSESLDNDRNPLLYKDMRQTFAIKVNPAI
jgi:hypothetical protein